MMTPKEIELAYKRVEYLNVVIDSRARLAARALLDGEPEAAYRFAKRMAGTEKVRDRIAAQLNQAVTDKEQS